MRKPEDIIETNFTKVYNEIHTKAKRIAFQRATKHANQLLLNRDLLELTGKKPEPESAISVVIVDDEYTVDVTVSGLPLTVVVSWMISGDTTITVTVSVGGWAVTVTVGGALADGLLE